MAASAVAPSAPSKKEKKQKISLFGQLQRIGKALMVPVAILPAAGLLLGIGAGAQNMYKQINDVSEVPEGLFKLITDTLSGAGDVIFGNLALLFAIGVAIGLTGDAGVAALAGTAGFLVFNKTISMFMHITWTQSDNTFAAGQDFLNWKDMPSTAFANVLGIPSLQTGVFGGIIVGALAAWCYNKWFRIELPPFLGFFAGKRFVPIATATFAKSDRSHVVL